MSHPENVRQDLSKHFTRKAFIFAFLIRGKYRPGEALEACNILLLCQKGTLEDANSSKALQNEDLLYITASNAWNQRYNQSQQKWVTPAAEGQVGCHLLSDQQILKAMVKSRIQREGSKSFYFISQTIPIAYGANAFGRYKYTPVEVAGIIFRFSNTGRKFVEDELSGRKNSGVTFAPPNLSRQLYAAQAAATEIKQRQRVEEAVANARRTSSASTVSKK